MSSTDVRAKVMDKTNQLFPNLPNGTFLFLRIQVLINFVLCAASGKEKWIGDRISLFWCPSPDFVTVLRHPVNFQLPPYPTAGQTSRIFTAHLRPTGEQWASFNVWQISLSLCLAHKYWCFHAAAWGFAEVWVAEVFRGAPPVNSQCGSCSDPQSQNTNKEF